MNVELLKELMEEILNENKEINKELQSLKSELIRPDSTKDAVLEKLKELKLNEELLEIKNILHSENNEISSTIQRGIINIETERKLFIKRLTSWKDTVISLLKISMYGFIFYMIILLFGKYYMPTIIEKIKYKNAYEFIYYDNENFQDYMQELILLFDDKESEVQLLNKTLKLRKESTNPLVFSK